MDGGERSVLVLGECLADLAPGDVPAGSRDGAGAHAPASRPLVALPGGSPANVAVGLARLAVPTAFAGRLSAKGLGPWLRQHLALNGVDLSLVVEAPEPPTLAVVTLDKEGRASYTFYGPETADWQWSEEELPFVRRDKTATPAQPGFGAVHTGSLATAFEPGASVLSTWLRALRASSEILISFDPNVRPGLVGDQAGYFERVDGFIASSHIVKASTDDLAALYPQESGSSVATLAGRVAERWLAGGASLVVVTDGGRGATAYHERGWQVHASPPPVTVKDTIGAGDSFTSGLLGYLSNAGLLTPHHVADLTEERLAAAMRQAVAASAFTCTRAGADPPDAAELDEFLSGSRARQAPLGHVRAPGG